MCDSATVRSWLVAAMVALGGAISSAVLGVAYPLIATGCFWAAVAWSILTLVFVGFASAALNTFCTCAADRAACGSPCRMMKQFMNLFFATVFIGGGLIGYAATHPWANWMAFAFILTGMVALGFAVTLLIYLVDLGKCQSTSPMPT